MSYTDLIPKKIPVNLFKVYNPFFNFVYSFHDKPIEKIWKTPIVSKYVESIFAQHFDPNGLHRKEHRLIREHFNTIESIDNNSDIDNSFSVISYNYDGNNKEKPLTIKEIKNLSSNTIILVQEAIIEGNIIDNTDRVADGKIQIPDSNFEITVSQSYSKHGCMVLYTDDWNKVGEPVKPFYVDKLLWQRSSYWNFLQKDNIYIAVISIHLKIPHSGSSLIKYFKMLQYLRIEAKILKEKGYHVFIGGDLQDIQWITKNKNKIAKDVRKKLILERERDIELDDILNIEMDDIEIINTYNKSEANEKYPILNSHFYKIKITKHTKDFFYIISLDFYYIKEIVNGEAEFSGEEKDAIDKFLIDKEKYFNEKNKKEENDDESESDVESDDNSSESDDRKNVKDEDVEDEDVEENQFKNLNELISEIEDTQINKIVKEMIKDDWNVNRIYNLKNFFAPVLYSVQKEEEKYHEFITGDNEFQNFFEEIKKIIEVKDQKLKKREYDFIFTSSNIFCNRKNITDEEKISEIYDKNHRYVEIVKEQGQELPVEKCILKEEKTKLGDIDSLNTCDIISKFTGKLSEELFDFQENKQTYMIKFKKGTELIPGKNRYMIDYPFKFEGRKFILKIIKSKGEVETSVSFLETSKVKSDIKKEFSVDYLKNIDSLVFSTINEIKQKLKSKDLPEKKTYFTSDDLDILCKRKVKVYYKPVKGKKWNFQISFKYHKNKELYQERNNIRFVVGGSLNGNLIKFNEVPESDVYDFIQSEGKIDYFTDSEGEIDSINNSIIRVPVMKL